MVEVVPSSCLLDVLPPNNFSLIASNETCVDKNNGMITITALESQNYVATIGGTSYNFNTGLEIPDLTPGSYIVCIAIDGVSGCEQCFELGIQEAVTLTGFTDTNIDNVSGKVTVAIQSGTAPFIAEVNGVVVGEYETRNFEVEAVHGDVLEVYSNVACEGKLTAKIDVLDNVSIYPNPTRSNAVISLPQMGRDTIEIEIRNALGMTVSSRNYQIIDNRVTLPMENLSAGIYFITMSEGTNKAFKIIKE